MISFPPIPKVFLHVAEDHKLCRTFIANLRKELNDNASIEKLQEYTCWFWRNQVTPMIHREENLLMKYKASRPGMLKKLKDDHEDILELLISIDQDAERFSFISLANLLEMHVIWEERELLPTLRNAVLDYE